MTVRKASTTAGTAADFEGDIKSTSKPPSQSDLQKAASLPILDASGKSHKFKSLYDGKRKVLIVFIRHFFCGVCLQKVYSIDSKRC